MRHLDMYCTCTLDGLAMTKILTQILTSMASSRAGQPTLLSISSERLQLLRFSVLVMFYSCKMYKVTTPCFPQVVQPRGAV